MNAVYISIETNVVGFEYYKKLWQKQGITGIRVGTMAEGIEAVVAVQKSKTQYLNFVDIVADDIDYMPQLEMLERVIEDAPILIATSAYDVNEHHTALDNGAYFYGQYNDDAEKNITVVNKVVKRYHHVKNHHVDTNVLTCSGVKIMLSQRQVYVNNEPIKLTKFEFDLLHYFVENRGTALSYEDIYTNVWHYPYIRSCDKPVKVMTGKLRMKITDNENEDMIIENLRNYGYIMR